MSSLCFPHPYSCVGLRVNVLDVPISLEARSHVTEDIPVGSNPLYAVLISTSLIHVPQGLCALLSEFALPHLTFSHPNPA